MAKFDYKKWVTNYRTSKKGLFEQNITGSITGSDPGLDFCKKIQICPACPSNNNYNPNRSYELGGNIAAECGTWSTSVCATVDGNEPNPGDFILVDAAARKTILKEITYQNDGMVDPNTAKLVGKQTGADLIILGNVYMKPESRDGKTIKQYSINLRMTDIERGVEVFRARTKVSKYSEQKKVGW